MKDKLQAQNQQLLDLASSLQSKDAEIIRLRSQIILRAEDFNLKRYNSQSFQHGVPNQRFMTQIERVHRDIYSPPHTSNEETNVNLIQIQNEQEEEKLEEFVVSDRSSDAALIKGVEKPELYLKNPQHQNISVHQLLKSRN